MLLRRCVVTPLAALLLFLFSLTVALFVPALTFLVRLTAWLDGDRLISAEAIMLPYITALLLLLTVMTGAVFFMAVSLSRRAVRAATDADVEADDEPPLEDLPWMFVRESSTLFRVVQGPLERQFAPPEHSACLVAPCEQRSQEVRAGGRGREGGGERDGPRSPEIA